MDDPMAAGRTARAALATPVEAPREPGCDVPSGEAAADLSALTGPTRLLDYDHALIQQLITERGWSGLAVADRVGAVYGFVRDEIAFGYNARDDLPASWVLAERVGQCNTKTTLLMALLRGVGVACRFHGFTIDRVLQRARSPGGCFR
jgi:transglutaminase-like putative cysteine protease